MTPAVEGLFTQPVSMVLGLALLGLLPFAFMTLTSFVKISTVLHITRSAIGAQSVPSTVVVMALSTALSFLVMAPVGNKMLERLSPQLESQPSSAQLVGAVLEASSAPLREFLAGNASEREKQRFVALARKADPARTALAGTQDFSVLIPAFIVTELAEAFALGFAIFLPFLIIDLVVGNVLMALGMQMMSPTQVSLPFKLLLFVMADGWGLLAQSLVSGYALG
jgi:type III secretion protein R